FEIAVWNLFHFFNMMIKCHAVLIWQVNHSDFSTNTSNYAKGRVICIATLVVDILKEISMGANNGEGIDRMTSANGLRMPPSALRKCSHLGRGCPHVEIFAPGEAEIEERKKKCAFWPDGIKNASQYIFR